MDQKELKEKILAEIEDFIASEESFGDTAMLSIIPSTGDVSIVDGEELTEEEMENSGTDYYDVMDFLEMDQEHGSWHPDMEAVAEVAKEY